eukprot:3374725-Rhodomonas_salina.1
MHAQTRVLFAYAQPHSVTTSATATSDGPSPKCHKPGVVVFVVLSPLNLVSHRPLGQHRARPARAGRQATHLERDSLPQVSEDGALWVNHFSPAADTSLSPTPTPVSQRRIVRTRNPLERWRSPLRSPTHAIQSYFTPSLCTRFIALHYIVLDDVPV